PAWGRRTGWRAALVAAACVLVCLPEWSRPEVRFGIGWNATYFPGPACDFIARHGLRGRLFAPNYYGGYVLWRFWPERDRLPFMDAHQSGTRADRDLYAYSFSRRAAWDSLEARHRFDFALLDGHQEWVPGDRLMDFLDADPDWALVFRDDAAAIYLRRDGALGSLADSLAYRVMPGGFDAIEALGSRVARDPGVREALRQELARAVRESPLNGGAHSHLANVAFLSGDRATAFRELEAALRVTPNLPTAHRRLGFLLLAAGRPRDAIRALEAELRLRRPPQDEHRLIGQAWEQLGDTRRAIAAYQNALAIHPA